MITLPRSAPIHLALEPVDFRKSFDGLSVAVVEALGRDPLSGELFVFRNRGGDKLKALYWDGQGFVLLYKRLERGRFVWPSPEQGAMALSGAQLQALFEGADWRVLQRLPDYPATAVT